MRMQAGHVREGVHIVKDIAKSEQDFMPCFSKLNLEDKAAYEYFKACWRKDSDEEKEFMKYVGDLRHSVTFHYDQTAVKNALAQMADRNDLSTSKLILDEDVHKPTFPIADGVIMCAIGSGCWGIDIFNSQGQEELKDRIAWMGQQSQRFYHFGRSLCTYYFTDYLAK